MFVVARTRGLCGATGVSSVFSIDHPLLSRVMIVQKLMSVFSAHSVMHSSVPWYSSRRFLDVLRFYTLRVAQRQLFDS